MRTPEALRAQHELDSELVIKSKQGDAVARKALLDGVSGTVYKLAHKYACRRFLKEDLIQEGFCGALQAIPMFNSKHGVTFHTFAKYHILNAMTHALTAGLTKTETAVFYHGRAAEKAIFAAGETPTDESIAKVLGIAPVFVASARAHLTPPMEVNFLDVDENESAEDYVIRSSEAADLRRKVYQAMHYLQDREKMVVFRTIMSDEPETQQDVATEWGLSRERVRQIQAKGLKQIKRNFKRLQVSA